MSDLLVDTQAMIWIVEGQRAVPDAARQRFDAPDGRRLFSVASLWEMAIKIQIGKLGRVWKPPAAKATAGGAAAKEGEAGGCGPRMQPDAGSGFSRRATPSGFSDAA